MKEVFATSIQSGLSSSGSYILMLSEPTSGTQVPIFIGAAEAQGVALAKSEVQPRRPMTHELMMRCLKGFDLQITKVTIDRVEEGVFYASLYVTDGFGEQRFDCRTSDAVSLALQAGCPILMDEKVLLETGMPDKSLPESQSQTPSPEERISKLEEELSRCEEAEDYERAAQLHDEIEKLKGII